MIFSHKDNTILINSGICNDFQPQGQHNFDQIDHNCAVLVAKNHYKYQSVLEQVIDHGPEI